MEIYDVYMSIGWACRPAHQLRINGLRDEAFPLDWQKDYSLDTVIHLFETNFEDFFKNIKEEGVGDDNSRRVIDVNNHIISLHHFPKELSLLDGQDRFLESMTKRYQNQRDRIINANKLFLLSNRLVSLDEMGKFLKDFSTIFPNKEIKLVNIRNDNNLNSEEIIVNSKEINDLLSIIDYTINDTYDDSGNEYDWKGNSKAWKNILDEYGNHHTYEIVQKYKNDKNPLIIYGAGQMCRALINIFNKYKCKPDGIAVTNIEGNPKEVEGIIVDNIDNYPKNSNIIISVKNINMAEEINRYLKNKGYKNISNVDKSVLME
ncbi:Putative papain-like cysteine peptidase [Pseudobutyrivibrio sp. AR14]|uniref:Papain-like cysteine peptidase n=1 Tax=Pseudobutyrivibrio ruminis TaxID=46206 RepID=A0A2G3EC89_9FIRM|nr:MULTISPECIES: DUF1796 family putative cysteine peptidase [Pseudobutyrivibrio]PHU40939.1 hypothetical protein CSX00_03040 [Pseudobutyrivibrio ruminis]SCY24028.1 Putative papain-like cysteine peptidase [Pseudobutyrivibrio sp. AR14]